MSTDPAEVIRSFTDDVQQGDHPELIDELFADDFYNHFPTKGVPTDRSGVHLLIKEMRQAVPDLKVRVDDMVIEGELVVTRKTFSGLNSGSWFGTPGSGGPCRFGVIDIMRVVDGRITEHWAGLMEPLFSPVKDD